MYSTSFSYKIRILLSFYYNGSSQINLNWRIRKLLSSFRILLVPCVSRFLFCVSCFLSGWCFNLIWMKIFIHKNGCVSSKNLLISKPLIAPIKYCFRLQVSPKSFKCFVLWSLLGREIPSSIVLCDVRRFILSYHTSVFTTFLKN